MILRARIILPIRGPALEDGAVRVRGGRIDAVGHWRDLVAGRGEHSFDLGDVAVLPGLVNAHCHLDYTDMAGQFRPPKYFTDWLKQITEAKAGWALEEYAASWRAGARMLLHSGTTSVADIEAIPELLPEAWDATPLRVISLLEMIGITNRRPPAVVLAETLERIAGLRHSRCRVGLSPHAP